MRLPVLDLLPLRALALALALPLAACESGTIEFGGEDSGGGDDDSAASDDDSGPGDDDTGPGDDDTGPGDDDTSGGDDDATPDPDDADGDGSPAGVDCDDTDPTTFPGAPEQCDGRDNDCSGGVPPIESDTDGDGFRGCSGDCDDADAAVHPGAEDECGGVDSDCDPATPTAADADGDGYFDCGGDCDDSDPEVHPGAYDVGGDGVDSDCDGTNGPAASLGSYCLGDTNTVEVGGTVTFSIGGSDASGDVAGEGRQYDDIEFRAEGGTHLVLWMRRVLEGDSPDPLADPRLLLLDATCTVIAEAHDHVVPYDTNARIDFDVPSDGVYALVATTEDASDTGDYLVGVWEDEPPLGEYCLDDPWDWDYGTEFNEAALNGRDWVAGPGGEDRYHDEFEFFGDAGDRIAVTLESEQVVAQVLLLGPACEVLAEAAGDPSGLAGRVVLEHVLGTSGAHTVVVSSVEPIGTSGSEGDYAIYLDG